jgi:hypothetical protein
MTTLPTPIADLVLVPNVALTSAVNQQTQYRQIGFAAHTWMQAMGYTVELSSNSVTAGAGNNIASVADIVFNTGGSAHSWAVYLEPGVGNLRFLIDFNTAAASATPQSVTICRCQSGGYTGGSTTARPTAAVASREVAVAWNMVGWSAPVAGFINYEYSLSQHVGIFFTKVAGATTSSSWLMIDRPAAADPVADGNRDWYIQYTSTPDTPTIIYPNFDGTAGASASALWTEASSFSFTATGVPSDGRPRLWPVHAAVNSATATAARCLGASQLLMGTVSGTPFNETDPDDPSTDLWSWRVIGTRALLWLKSSGVIQ